MDSKHKIYLTSIIFIALFCAEIFGLIPFLFSKINSTSVNLAKERQNLEVVQKNAREAAAAEDKYQAIKPHLDEISKSLLDRGEVLDFIMVLEKVASETGNQSDILVITNNSGTKAAEKKEADKAMRFQVSLNGSFSNLVKFLSKVENMPYLNDIDGIQIRGYGGGLEKNNADQADSGAAIATTINIKVYLKP